LPQLNYVPHWINYRPLCELIEIDLPGLLT
jgi:hypothetical protein